MAGSQRVERLAEQFKIEIADILRRMKDPRIGFVSITDVEMAGDLRHVRVFVSILGDEESQLKTMEALEHATGYVRSEVGSRIRLRYTPDISFRFDPSLARGARIFELLAKVKQDGPGTDQGEEG
jgi:ribosome-binding factor A